jgi:hypothetical protein
MFLTEEMELATAKVIVVKGHQVQITKPGLFIAASPNLVLNKLCALKTCTCTLPQCRPGHT